MLTNYLKKTMETMDNQTTFNLDLGPVPLRGLAYRRNLTSVELTAQKVLSGVLENQVHICTVLGIIPWVLRAPCYCLIEVTLECRDIVSTVVTK